MGAPNQLDPKQVANAGTNKEPKNAQPSAFTVLEIRYQASDPKQYRINTFWNIFEPFFYSLAAATGTFFLGLWYFLARLKEFRLASNFGYLELYFYFEPLLLWLRTSPWKGPSKRYRRRAGRSNANSARELMLKMLAKLVNIDAERHPDEAALLAHYAAAWFDGDTQSQVEVLRRIRSERADTTSLDAVTRQFADLFSWSKSMRAHALDFLCEMAAADGRLDPKEDHALRSCADILGVPLQEYLRLMNLKLSEVESKSARFSSPLGDSEQEAFFGERKRSYSTGPRREEKRDSTHKRARTSSQGTDSEGKAGSHQPHGDGNSKNWWDVLAVKRDATDGEIKRAYRKLVMLYHPDRLNAHGLPDEQRRAVSARFIRIQNAYEAACESIRFRAH